MRKHGLSWQLIAVVVTVASTPEWYHVDGTARMCRYRAHDGAVTNGVGARGFLEGLSFQPLEWS